MPIEIMELIIRASVRDTEPPKDATESEKLESRSMERELIIRDAVEQTLEILRRDREP